MKRFVAGLFAAVLLSAPAVAPAWAQTQPAKPLWAHLASDIAPDPAITFGSLPNGMRYALMKNQLPPGAVSIRFSFDFGSLHEAENEKGLAHFIEHMAFNGSKNVPEGEMVKKLERLGLAFGAHTNASTSQKFTTYMLELPNASDALVDESLFLMRELASELTFNADAIDRERGVVLAEWRRGDNFQRRRSDQQLAFLLPGAYAPSRMPIGDPKVLETVSRDTMVSLYDRFYRPERATMVIVGDFDVAAMERRIRDRFGDWRGRGEAGKNPDLSYEILERPSAASVFTHGDGGDSISVYSFMPFREETDTAAQRRADNLLMFAIGALSRRLAPLTNAEDPPFRSAGLSTGDMLETVRISGGSVTVTPESWKPGLQTLEQEWRRALLHGFTQDEVDLQIKSLRTSQQNQAQREKTRTTGALMNGILSAIQNNTVFATPSSGLARFEGWAGDVTPAMVHEAFRRWMPMDRPMFFMTTSAERPGVDKEIVAAWEESSKVEVKPPAEKSGMGFAYTNFGTPGKVVKDARLADIDTRTVTFANNVRLNIKKTDFQKNVVQVSLRVGSGVLDLPETPYGLSSIMSAYSNGGLEKHSADDLRTILAGKQVSTRFGASGTSFGSTYSTTPADLELQLQLAAAFLTHPGYRPEAERRWRQGLVLSWPRLDANAGTVWSAKGMRLLASGDKRFGTDPDDGDVSRSFTELRAYLGPILSKGAIEIAIVGDVDEKTAIDAVAKTFGALPARDPAATKFKAERPAVFRKDKTPILLTHDGEPNQAIASVYWPVEIDPDADPQAARVMGVLASVMRLKVTAEIREALGATYSPSAGSSLSSVYPGFGYVSAGAEVKPEDADKVIAAFRKIVAEMRSGDISDDEFSRAITPSLEVLPQNSTSNGYWLSLISQAQTRPEVMERNKLAAIERSVRAVTKADVVAAANRWLGDADALEARVMPSKKAAD
jgi:zinc protease